MQFLFLQIQSEHHSQGHARLTGIGGQNGDAIRVAPAKDRVANTEHEPLAFEC